MIAFNGRAVAREVKVLSQRSDGYLVDGLTGGEDIIVNAPADLKDGDRVKIKRSGSLEISRFRDCVI